MATRTRSGRLNFGLLILCALALLACGKPQAASNQGLPPAEVSVYRTAAGAVTPTDTLPGRVCAFRTAEIRPQVGGIVRKRLFEQGSEVRAGQTLFQIDPDTFKADARTAEAATKRAEAAAANANLRINRLKPLVSSDAISRQTYDDALAEKRQADASLAEARATLDRRRLDLRFASVASPIAGRIDQALVTEGALVAAGDANPMALVQEIDKVFVDVRQPASRLEELRAEAAQQGSIKTAAIEILSAEGKPYPIKGKLLFSGVSVDPATGEVLARIIVDNPNRSLLPGMYVQARLPRPTLKAAIMVPQQAVRRDDAGNPTVYVVDKAGKVTMKPVSTGDVENGWYIISSGLRAGEDVIVEGHDHLMPGAAVKPVKWQAAPQSK